MKKHRISDVITMVLFISILFGFAGAFVIMPDKESNGFETNLQQFPNAKSGDKYKGLDYVIHGELADDFDVYFCDQFPLRKQFVSLKALVELLSYRGVSNGVLLSDGRLAQVRFDSVGTEGNTEFYSKEHVDTMLDSLKSTCSALSVPIKVILPPRTIDVIASKANYPEKPGLDLDAAAKDKLGDNYISVLNTMRALDENSMLPYYKTDHHWTSVGAYYAYEAAVKAMGDTPYDIDSFSFETVKEDFCGTAYRNGNYFFLEGEELQLARYEGDDAFDVKLGYSLEYLAEKDSMYDMKALDGEDPYNIFLHGKTKYVTISKEGADRETLLVVKDSFAHSLVPLLARNYNIVMVDIDLCVNVSLDVGIDLEGLVKDTGADKVLIVYNMQNLIENENLSLITADGSNK